MKPTAADLALLETAGFHLSPMGLTGLVPDGVIQIAENARCATTQFPADLGLARMLVYHARSGLCVIATGRGPFVAVVDTEVIYSASAADPNRRFRLFFSGAQCWMGPCDADRSDAHRTFALALDRSSPANPAPALLRVS